MTESMKTLLHRQATSVAFKPSELETIVSTSQRRIRRRRALATLATVVAVALAGGGVAVVLGSGTDDPRPPLPAIQLPFDAVSWATGSTIHVGATNMVEVGHEVHAFVRTVTGFVILDETDVVYSVTAAGVTRIGQMHDTLPDNTDEQRLAVDSHGTRVAWVDEEAVPDGLAVRIYDPVDGSTLDIPEPLTTPDVHLLPGVNVDAVSDRAVYFRTYEGVHEYDLASGNDRLIVTRAEVSPGDAIYSYEVYSAANGVIAYTPNDDHTIFAGRSVKEAIKLFDFPEYESPIQIPDELKARGAEVIVGHTDPARLSPTGSWLSFGLVEMVIVPVGPPADEQFEFGEQRHTSLAIDTATGERVRLAIPDGMRGMPSVWLDDTTVQVVAFPAEQNPTALPTSILIYACSVPDGTCQLAAQFQLTNATLFAFPDGRWYGGP